MIVLTSKTSRLPGTTRPDLPIHCAYPTLHRQHVSDGIHLRNEGFVISCFVRCNKKLFTYFSLTKAIPSYSVSMLGFACFIATTLRKQIGEFRPQL